MVEENFISRVCETIEAYQALGNERFQACGATFIRNRDIPGRYDANSVGLIRDAAQVDELIARADIEYAHLAFRQFHIDPLTPPEVEASLALAGYNRWTAHLVMVLEGELLANPRQCEISQVVSQQDWDAYRELQDIDQVEYDGRMGRPAVPPDGQYLVYVRAKAPPVRSWLAHVDGVPRAYISSWSGENGVGQVEDLFVHPEYRHRGLGTALLAHGVSAARSEGAGPVALIADPTDTPMRMYEETGFKALFLARSQYR
jgi:GNAT superfamily N-acetyltransferase